MNDQKHIVGIIHARGASTRIPLKNIKKLNGKPLIGYMIQATASSKLLQRVVVSTDHLEIRRIALEFGAEVPFLRPPEISTDCPSELVTQHAVDFIEKETGKEVDIAVTMQPTTPFCLGHDIDSCIKMLLENPQWDSVFSAGIVMERPEWMYTVAENSSGSLLMPGVLQGERGISQSLPPLFMPNGAVYATRRDELMHNSVLISEKTGIYVMPPERSVDIDVPMDFEFAEFLARKMDPGPVQFIEAKPLSDF